MARAAVAKAVLAAEALDAFLRGRARHPEPPPIAAEQPRSDGVGTTSPPVHGRKLQLGGDASRPQPVNGRDPGRSWRPVHTDWLHHRFTVTGPTEAVTAFRDAASGAGTIPWQLDLERLEEDWFLLLAHPERRELSLTGARTLAGQLREAVERRHALAVSRVGRSRPCPLDLHALLPVPLDILRLGPDHPDALAWLWQHWGTTEPLRHVCLLPPGKPMPASKPGAGESSISLSFWSADWTPWRALERVRAEWPLLRFDVRPDYATS